MSVFIFTTSRFLFVGVLSLCSLLTNISEARSQVPASSSSVLHAKPVESSSSSFRVATASFATLLSSSSSSSSSSASSSSSLSASAPSPASAQVAPFSLTEKPSGSSQQEGGPEQRGNLRVPETLLGSAPPYVPRKTEYSLEMGWLRAHEDFVHLGGVFGVNVGRCVFSDSQTCQQYLDVILGGAMRDGETYALPLASLRWQYVNLPARFGPFWRIFAGAGEIHRESRRWRAVTGVGYGVNHYLHDKVDLRLELRVGVIDRVYGQALVGLQIKADRLLTFFAGRLRDLGYGTLSTAVEATGSTLGATGEGLGELVEGVSSSLRDRKDDSGKDETASPVDSIESD